MKRLRIVYFVIGLVLIYLIWMQYFWIDQAGKRVEHEYRLKADRAIQKAVERYEQRYYCASVFLEEELKTGDRILLTRYAEQRKEPDTLNTYLWRFFSSDSLYQFNDIRIMSPARMQVHLKFMFYNDSLREQFVGDEALDSLTVAHLKHPLEYPERFRRIFSEILAEELQLEGIFNAFGWRLESSDNPHDQSTLPEFQSDTGLIGNHSLELIRKIFHNDFFVKPYTLSVSLYNIGKYHAPELINGIIATIFIIALLIIGLAMIYRISQQQMKVEAMQSDFISNITHEFNTPVSNLKLALESLRKAILASDKPRAVQAALKSEKLLSIAEEEAKRIENNTGILLQAGMLGHKIIPQQEEKLAMTDFIRDINTKYKLRELPALDDITLHAEATNDIIAIDPRHCMNVILNIYDNAVKYASEPVKIDVYMRNKSNSLVIEIVDNGQGIEKKHLPFIFNKFYRGSTGNIHDVKGFGLGLYYARQIIENAGGNIEVMSKYGYGSRFNIRLPLAR